MGTAAVGAFAMIAFACVALLIPIMPRIFMRFGIGRVYLAGMALESVCTLGYIAFIDSPDAFAWWCASSVLGGIGAAAVWNATEALLAEHAPHDQRGKVMGLYQTALGAALAAGPFVPALLGWQPKTTLIAAAIVQFGALGIALRLKLTQAAHHPAQDEGQLQIGSTWQAVRRVPALVLIAFAGGVFEAGLSSISAANGAALGLSLAQASSIVGALYTLTMIEVAHHFDARMGAQAVASGTAAMITGYTLGGALGPLISGGALQWLGAWGLSGWLSLLSIAVLWASLQTNTISKITR